MHIAICDDEEVYREAAKTQCLQFFKERDVIIELFPSGEEYLSIGIEFDLLFLDIEMQGEDGISIKDNLEKEGKHTRIVFLTSHEERMREAFGKNVIGFLTKPLDTEMFNKIMNKVVSDISGVVLEVEEGNKFFTIPIKTIRYIEAQDKYTLVVTQAAKELFRKPIKYWEQELIEGDFCRINKSFLVNFEYFKKDKDEIVLDKDKRVKVSRKYKDLITEQYKNYLRKKAKEL